MMKKFGTRVLTAVIASSLIVTPVIAAPSIDDIKKSKESAQGEVNSLQEQLTEIVGKIDTLEKDLVKTSEEIDTATVDLEKAKELEKQQYEDMKLRIKYMYEQGDASAFEAIINAKDFSDLMNKAEYVQKVHAYDRKKLNEYIETKEKVASLKTKLEKEKKELESLGAEYEAQEGDLNTMIEEKQGEVANLDEELQAAVAEVARRAAEEEAKAKEEEEKKAQQQAANGTTAQNNTDTKADNGKTDNDKADSGKKDDDKKDDSKNDDKKDEPGYSTPVGGSVVDRAYGKLGCPYVYGACGPNTFDCSGFVSYCLTGKYTRIGTSGTFASWPKVSNPRPGDVCVKPGHVGIYIGNGQMIHAPHTGDVVKISSVHAGMWYVRR